MPRPSLKAERTEAILDAVETCVLRYGVHGATLDKIAETAGMQRSLLRHNVGNREDLLDAFLNRFFARSDQEVAAMLASLPASDRVEPLLDILFDDRASSTRLALVALALNAAAGSDEEIRQRLGAWNNRFVETIRDELGIAFPTAPRDTIYVVATGLTAIYFNKESVVPLVDTGRIQKASRHAAIRLVQTLA